MDNGAKHLFTGILLLLALVIAGIRLHDHAPGTLALVVIALVSYFLFVYCVVIVLHEMTRHYPLAKE